MTLYDSREEALKANGHGGGRPPSPGTWARAKAAQRRNELQGSTHGVRKRATSGLAALLEQELDALEGNENMPVDQKIALYATLDMMLSERPSVQAKGREAYLRIKGFLLTKKDEAAQRADAARAQIEGLM